LCDEGRGERRGLFDERRLWRLGWVWMSWAGQKKDLVGDEEET
jgi:hypothetical protein